MPLFLNLNFTEKVYPHIMIYQQLNSWK